MSDPKSPRPHHRYTVYPDDRWDLVDARGVNTCLCMHATNFSSTNLSCLHCLRYLHASCPCRTCAEETHAGP